MGKTLKRKNETSLPKKIVQEALVFYDKTTKFINLCFNNLLEKKWQFVTANAFVNKKSHRKK